jgi:hypothetical protein
MTSAPLTYSNEPMPPDDACCVCGHRHAEYQCATCDLQLCHKHRECPALRRQEGRRRGVGVDGK